MREHRVDGCSDLSGFFAGFFNMYETKFSHWLVRSSWLWILFVAWCFMVFILMLEYKNIISSTNKIVLAPGMDSISLMYIEKSMGDRLEPCGTPVLIGWSAEWESSIRTFKILSARNALFILTSWVKNILCRSLWCHSLLKAFLKSKNTAFVRRFLLAAITRLSVRPVSWIFVEGLYRNPNCSGRICGANDFLRRGSNNVSYSHDNVLRSDIGL